MATQAPGFDQRSMLASGSRVIVIVSAGPLPAPPHSFAEVPDVLGVVQGKALADLQEAGLAAQVFNDYSDVRKRGAVIGQLPRAGASAPAGSVAVLLVSSGPASSPARVEVLPDVTGKSEPEAVSVLQAARFSPQVVREYSTSVPAGVVMAQLPSRTTLAAQPEKRTSWAVWAIAAVVLVVLAVAAFFLFRPSEKIAVPAVTGLAQAEAVKAIEDAGLVAEVRIVEPASEDADDVVLAQDPKEGIEVGKNTAVRIDVPQAVEPVEVPDVVGENQASATKVLRAAGFEVSVTRGDSLTVDKGLVIEQTPEGGAGVTAGSEVSIVISDGPPQNNRSVPDVEGLTSADAQEALADLGLKVVIAENASSDVANGIVISQLPAAGDSVAPGTSVGIVVSTGAPASPDDVETPDVTGMTLAEAQQVITDAGLDAIPVPSTGSGKPANEVVAQTPDAGAQVQTGSSVVLFYSSGQ